MTLKELKEQINYFDSEYDEMTVLVRSYVEETAIYVPSEVRCNMTGGYIEISLDLDNEE